MVAIAGSGSGSFGSSRSSSATKILVDQRHGRIVVREFCKGKIAHYKIPRYIKFVDSFPMTVTGKIQKFLMRQTSIEELGLQDAASIKTA